jgi:hypothetical protein
MRSLVLVASLVLLGLASLRGATPPGAVDWAAVEAETLRHFQAIVRLDTSDPPGNELPVVEYLKRSRPRASK